MVKKYYSLKNILSKNADYNIIIGERSNGKTYSVLEYILKKALKDINDKSVYLRRLKEDITIKRMNTLFTPFDIVKMSKGKYNTIVFSKGAFSFALKENDEIQDITEPFLFTLALSDMEHDKSTSYPQVNTIFFEEFLTRTFYLKDEFIIFMNVISTVVRDRENVKIFLCGNTVNQYSPYFAEFGLTNIKTQKQGSIDVYEYSNSGLKVAVEYCDTLTKNKSVNKYFAFNNPHLSMITSGKWEIGNYSHLPHDLHLSDYDIIFTFFIKFDNDIIQGDIYFIKDLFIYFHRKTTELKESDFVYSLESGFKLNERGNILLDNLAITSKIKGIINNQKVYYQNNQLGEIFRNYIQRCKK